MIQNESSDLTEQKEGLELPSQMIQMQQSSRKFNEIVSESVRNSKESVLLQSSKLGIIDSF